MAVEPSHKAIAERLITPAAGRRPHRARADDPAEADRRHRQADRCAGVRAVWADGGGDWDC